MVQTAVCLNAQPAQDTQSVMREYAGIVLRGIEHVSNESSSTVTAREWFVVKNAAQNSKEAEGNPQCNVAMLANWSRNWAAWKFIHCTYDDDTNKTLYALDSVYACRRSAENE